MVDNLIRWILSTITSIGFLAGIAYLFKDVLTRYFTKSVESRFEKDIERFKAKIISEEKELTQIREMIVAARRERDVGLQAKRFASAEMLLSSRKFLLEFYGLVDFMRLIKFDQLLKDYDKNKVKDLVETIIKPYDLDDKLLELKKYDHSIPKLYLNERVIAYYEAYRQIIMHAVTAMKLISMEVYKGADDFKSEALVKTIQELVPASKDGFDKYGYMYAFSWVDFFYEGILKELRNDLFGSTTMDKDTESAVRLVIDANNAQLKVRTALSQYNLPEQFLNK
ncbi:hypothetical protein OGX69_13535 [Citrobacter sp. Cb130]|uniref:hypothetical protein n=1 Tax=Citrobacter sp. Cb130 TaxID=2985033 RepID=UPI0025777B2E|nr:hypothetical protein [Citrobacter sp. Cb130]EIN0457402.1 hypothetical protein [Escherichia coli]MDM3328850.1 hypothetical protein [Citrobacter sp. Cb130]